MEKNRSEKRTPGAVTSPRQLNEYIKVASPAAWLFLAIVCLLLVGVSVWGIFGRLDTKVRAAVLVENGTVSAYVLDDEMDAIKPGEELFFDDNSCHIRAVFADPVCVDDDFEEYIRYVGNFEFGSWVRILEADAPDTSVADGIYRAEIVTESISPISFLLN